MNYKLITRKESIIISAIDILSKEGIRGMTMKKIAEKEEISEPAVYRHYKSKKDVVVAILEKFSRYDDQIIGTVVQQNLEPREAIVFFASSILDYYQGYPEVATVMFSLDVFSYNEETNTIMDAIIKKRCDFLSSVVSLGIEKDIFCIDLEKDIIVDMIYGFIMHTTFAWKSHKQSYDLKKRVLKMLESIFTG